MRRATHTGLCVLVAMLCIAPGHRTYATGMEQMVRFVKTGGEIPLSASGTSTPLCASSRDYPGVTRILKIFRSDIAAVTGSSPDLFIDRLPAAKEIVIVGTLGKCPLIDRLVKSKRIDVRGIEGVWEASLVQTVDHPFPGVDRALVIAGSDKRGTIYGMFDISRQIGVSPWYWWADVPIRKHTELYIPPGRYAAGPPSVRYRGIFLNDEFPDLTKWIQGKYGPVAEGKNPPIPAGVANYGHEFYERVFELLLRLKANYLWPAMWNNAFNEDDPENPKLADEYGIVMGTSHQEPMLRAQKEWDRRYKSTLGSWNYAKHPDTLLNFWREGVRRNKSYESIFTIGLRGADDTPMAPGGPAENMALLESVIGRQRKILAEEFSADASQVPQLWCLYKEVLEFYNAGMRAPDDVTLLWPDDNWGNIRRLPTAEERKRSGGAGIYYHFDYHGSPRNYQWINTNPIAKIWEQMSLAKEYGADRIWIVNVGHLKGYELPLEFFMDLAWDTARWTNTTLDAYVRQWAEGLFGAAHSREIAQILSRYTRYNGRRKPELLGPATYSLINYHEAETVVSDFQEIAHSAEGILKELPAADRDAFYELAAFPAKASALVNEIYLAAGKNALYAKQGRSSANDMAEETRALFSADTVLMGYFNRSFASGKWNHFMDQTHLGYTTWQDPPSNSLGAIPLVEIPVNASASLGIAVEGSADAWPAAGRPAALPPFDPFNRQRRSIDVFNGGSTPYTYTATSDRPWISLSAPTGEVSRESRIWVSIDWRTASSADAAGTVTITGAGKSVPVHVVISSPSGITPESLRGFVETEGCVSIEAEHHTKISASGGRQWLKVEGYGHTLSAMRATSAADAAEAIPGKDSPCLEYRIYFTGAGKVIVDGTFGPTLNFNPGRGVRYAVSFDDGPPEVVTLVPRDFIAQHGNMDWEKTVGDNARHGLSSHTIAAAGYHTLKIWMVDPGVVLEKIVVDCGGARSSYLGPPESYHRILP